MGSGRLFAAGLIYLTLLVSLPTYAADSAESTGIVQDENRVPIVAAQVSLALPSEPPPRAETAGAGRFTFRGLPAGDYKAEVREEGFFLLSGKEVALHAGLNDIIFTLNHAQELHEQVQVVAPANQIDVQDTAQRSTLTAEDIRDIPVPSTHVLQQSLIALPEIVQDNLDNLHIAGARSADTQYLLDGFEIGDPANGTL